MTFDKEDRMRILFLGDIVGRTGRDTVGAALPGLRERLRIDLAIVNAENAEEPRSDEPAAQARKDRTEPAARQPAGHDQVGRYQRVYLL